MDPVCNACEQCGCELPATGTLFLHEGRVICRNCNDDLTPICPTCNEPLAKRPESTGPCPLCGWPIHVVREQDLYESSLLNREQMERLTELRKRIGILRRYGVTEGEFARTQAELRHQTGQEPDVAAIMRRLFHLAAKNCRTDADCAVVRYAEARFLHSQGIDYYHVLRRAHHHRLESLKARGIGDVTIAGPVTSCAYCKKRAGVALPADEELRDPQLPHPDCPNRTADTEMYVEGELHKLGINKNAFCEATYEPCGDKTS